MHQADRRAADQLPEVRKGVNMDVHEISKAILEDKSMTFDDVDLLFDVLRTKQRRIGNAVRLRIGDRVMLRNIKPKYLSGQLATVKGGSGNKIEVELDQQVGRYGRKVRVARTCLEKIEDPTPQED